MGNFYTNCVLRKVAPSAVAEALGQLGRRAYVTTQPNDVVCVYDEVTDTQDMQELSNLCEQLSGRLQCVVWGVLNHDDSLLYYELWDRGECLDEYCSNPSYFGDGDEDGGSEGEAAETGGDAGALAEAFEVPDGEGELAELLAEPDRFLFVFELHLQLCQKLGVPEEWAIAGYSSLSMGEMIEGLNPEELLLVGA